QRADTAKSGIAPRVTMGVVDPFEMIDVEHDTAQRLALGAAAGEQTRAFGEEGAPGLDTGQDVERCLSAKFHEFDRKTGEIPKNGEVVCGRMSRYRVEYAQGSDIVAGAGRERRAPIGSD